MQKSTMESASWQRPLYGFKINQKQAKTPLKSGFSNGLVGGYGIVNLRLHAVIEEILLQLIATGAENGEDMPYAGAWGQGAG